MSSNQTYNPVAIVYNDLARIFIGLANVQGLTQLTATLESREEVRSIDTSTRHAINRICNYLDKIHDVEFCNYVNSILDHAIPILAVRLKDYQCEIYPDEDEAGIYAE